jgi:membrane AbrB-like protein
MPCRPPRRRALGRLLALTALLSGLLALLRTPAPTLLGAIVAGVALALGERRVPVPMAGFMLSQGLLGMMIARACPLPVFAELMRHWEVFLLGVTSVIVLSVGLGWQLARWRLLPGSTAIWGSFPGAATAMTLLAGEFGADVRLVALMQYLRVVMVASLMMVAAAVVGGATRRPACWRLAGPVDGRAGADPGGARWRRWRPGAGDRRAGRWCWGWPPGC